jgi:hypothetical protein
MHNFRKKFLNVNYVLLIFSTIFIWNISHFKNNSTRYHKCKNFCTEKYTLFFSDFNEILIFSTDFREKKAQT